jgi:hypothetical protein
MRTLAVLAMGAIASLLVAMGVLGGAMALGLIAQPGPHQVFEIAAESIGVAAVAVGTAIIFAIVLAIGGRRVAIRWTAFALLACLVLALAAPAILGLMTTDSGDVDGQDQLRLLAVFLTVIALSGVAVILVQWWTIGRHLARAATLDAHATSRGE